MSGKKTSFALILLALSTGVYAQEREFNLTLALKFKDIEEVKERVTEYASEHKGTAQSIYLQALMEQDGQQALEFYGQLFSKFANSSQAEDALYKIGLYYFARGLYVTARKHFLNLIEGYPRSPLKSEAAYFAAMCLCAAKQTGQCRAELRRFVDRFQDSEMVEVARQDLDEDGSLVNGKSVRPKAVPGNGGQSYAVQVGAFTQANNALSLRTYFAKLSQPVEIRKKKVGKQTVYQVLIGSFKTREAAKVFGDNLKKEHGKPYRIVSK
ncbi:MAG: SPOR domain-containing protein [bacterium]